LKLYHKLQFPHLLSRSRRQVTIIRGYSLISHFWKSNYYHFYGPFMY